MQSEMFATLPPTKLFFKCAVPAVVTSVFGALYSVVFSFSVKFILTLGLVKTLKLKAPGTVSPKTSP